MRTFATPILMVLVSLGSAWGAEADAIVQVGKQHLKDGEFRQATKAFRKAKKLAAPKADELLALSRALGRAERSLTSRRLARAKESLEKAAAIAPEHPQLTRLQAALARWDARLAERGSLPGAPLSQRTKHFRIQHHHPYLAARIAKLAETHLAAVLRDLAYPGMKRPKLKPFKLRIHRDRAEYAKKTGDLGAVSTGMAISETEIVTYQRAALSVLKHEITHLVIHAYLPMSPLWIHEGIASGGYTEASPRAYAQALRCRENKQFMPWKDLFALPSMGEIKVPRWAFYLQSRMLIELLLHGVGDLHRLHRFGRKARQRAEAAIKRYVRSQPGSGRITVNPLLFVNEEVPRLLREVYGLDDLAALDRAFERFLKHRQSEAALQARERPVTCHFEAKHRLDSAHVTLFTTTSKKVAKPLLALAERVRAAFYQEFWRAGVRVPKRVKVYLFDTPSEYAAFSKKHGMAISQGRHGVLPHFNPMMNAACLFRGGISKDYLHQVLAHEVAHALSWNLMRTAAGRAPWLIEGIAHYVGLSVHAKTHRVILGRIHETTKSKAASYLKTMDEQGAVAPLSRFVALGMGRIRTVQAHVQCWGLFHFLQHAEGGAYRAKFRAFLADVSAGKGSRQAGFEAHFGPASALEDAFRKYVRRLKPTSRRR